MRRGDHQLLEVFRREIGGVISKPLKRIDKSERIRNSPFPSPPRMPGATRGAK